MNKNLIKSSVFCLSALCSAFAFADGSLEKVISSGELRCGVQLDFPPSGYRNLSNEPEGYDVSYCKDMAKALGVKATVIETPSSERIPSLVANRIDVLIASTSITPERAMTVSFSQPYLNLVNVVLTNNQSSVEKFNDLKGKKVGGVTGTTTQFELRNAFDEWNDPNGSFINYGSESDSYLALSQGKIDGLILSAGTASALVQSGQFPSLAIKGEAPTPPDLTGIAMRKSDNQLQEWVRVFVWNQVKTGRYEELYLQYFGGENAPSLELDKAEY